MTPSAHASHRSWGAIAAGERLRFAGTEPFWGGTARGGWLRWTTPENLSGQLVRVKRQTGTVLTLTGRLRRGPFTMTVRAARCNDGMSDRTYPYEVTVRFRRETLHGCGWTARRPYSGSE